MKTILITGSTDGIGKMAALNLAKMGHRIWVHGRNETKIQSTISEIQSINSDTPVEGFLADFSDLKAVEKMAKEVNTKIPSLDVLINNAGVLKVAQPITSEGLDVRFAVNYYAPYILTNSILNVLKKGNSPRVINVSSAGQSPVSLEALKGEKTLSQQEAYPESKLANTMWSTYLAQNEKSILVISVNPGSLLNTNMANEAFGRHINSADKGANILTKLATDEKYQGHSGDYYDNDFGKFRKANKDAYNDQKIKALINTTNEVLQKLDIKIPSYS